MVKLDSTKDYYAALELTSSADETDIKKAFRRLAFKYHPDRNPGKEAEFNIKFQEIQAANEILTDAQTKARYDAERSRALPTRARGYAPTSAFQSAQAKYPPPPRRTADPTARRAPRPPPPPPPPPTQKPRRPGPAVPPRNQTESNIPSSDARSTFDNTSKYRDYFQANGAGFSAAGTASNAEKLRAWNSMRSGPYQKTQSDDDMFAAPSPKKNGFGDTPFGFQRPQRARADWDEPDFNKTNPSRTNSGLGRSQTQRTPKKTGFDPATPGGDEPPAQRASAYFHRPREHAQFYPSQSDLHNEYKAQGTTTESTSANDYDDPNNIFANDERLRTPYGMSTREKTYFSSGAFDRPKSAADASPPKQHTATDGRTSSRSHRDPIYISDEDEELSFVSERKVPADPDFGKPNRRDSRKSGAFGADVSSAEQQRRHSHAAQSSKTEFDSDADFMPFKPSRVKTDTDPSYGKSNNDPAKNGSSGQPDFKPSIFASFTNKPPKSTPVSQKPSIDSIDLQFSPSQFAGNFSGNNDGYFSADPAKIANRRKASPRKRPPPANIPVPQVPIPGGFSEAPQTDEEERPASNQSQPDFASGTFSSDEWSKHFNQQAWAAPPGPTVRPSATVRSKSSGSAISGGRKNSARAKASGIPQATDDDSEDEVPRWAPGAPEPTIHRRVSDENAMDVDPPAEPEPSTSFPGSTIPSQVGGNASTVSSNINSDGKASDAEAQSVPIIDLTDLGKQPPFAPSQTGLGDLKDLNTTLPFQSKASPHGPSLPARSPNPRPLHLPQPPRAPPSPMEYDPADRLTTVGQYLNRVTRYMREWNHYNSTMISHFQERASKASSLPDTWCQTLDHGTMYNVLAAYKADVEEDFVVREHWDKSWKTHLRVLQDLEAVKKWSLKGQRS